MVVYEEKSLYYKIIQLSSTKVKACDQMICSYRQSTIE